MDFKDTENKCSSSNLFNVHICESSFSQDAQYRPCKSPRKRHKVARTSASLMMDQLKSVFRYPSDLISRIRARRNWRPEFLTRYLYDNRRIYKKCDAILRHDKRNFVPETPKIYSIGLRSGANRLSDNIYDDLSSLCGTKNFKKRFNTVRRPTIVCKYWIAQSTPTSSLSTDVSFEAHTDRQTMIIDYTKSTESIPKHNRAQKNNHNSHHSLQLHEHIANKESNISDTLRNDRTVDNLSFISGDFKDPSVRKDHKYDSSCMRDAQIQTWNKKSWRRRKMKRRSKPATEEIPCRKSRNEKNELQIIADFRTAHSRNSSRKNDRDEPWLRVRFLENKRAEYINKFTAVNQQMEEITATLRETCCDGENSRNNLENCDEYFSSISDDAKVNTINRSGGSTIGKRNTPRENKRLINVKRIIGESKSDRCKSMQEILHVDNVNNDTISSSKETIASSRNRENIPNDAFDRDSVRAIKEAVYSSNRIFGNETRTNCRFIKQMSFDLAKNQNDEFEECSIEDKSFDKVWLKNNFAILSNEEHARDRAESLANLKESRYCKIIEEKTGEREIAVLKDIKKRIDKDFDDPSIETSDTEDFLTVSQKDSYDHYNIVDVTATTIEESKSTPLIVSTSLDPIETEIHNSMSIDAISEYSNKNSALSKYFSCTRIPSLISLTKNEEDKLTLETIDRSIISYDSHSNLPTDYHYYDSRSNFSLNNCSFSNLDSSFDHSRSSLGHVAHYNSTFSNKFLIKRANEPYDTLEISESQESFAKDKIYEWNDLSFEKNKKDWKEWRSKKRYNSTLATSKSSRYVDSIDSGVFSSSLIDLYPAESSFDIDRTKFKKKRCAGKLESSAIVDSGSDSSCTDDTLDRKVNDVVRDLTKNLILCERKAKMRLKERDAYYSQHVPSRACKFNKDLYDTCCDLLNSPRRSSISSIVSISTPSLVSLSDSEIEDCESRRQRAFC